ncbi:hypothetical protein AUJ77_03175 [Candidatus Nomurabacteria bacterium CG1_02_43_90]|uniref:Uncharacterized protein n=1 Tax=Candidatus Nomurabacteria bacterium CG1_02_43_90 TaxID=1805281 RepID=A0A1J4V377_9BACT|nr:MAG: hypothetical protein AUJ77_03175 [Candidatus Nomurabacteria bacterium CG1_02_43_90]
MVVLIFLVFVVAYELLSAYYPKVTTCVAEFVKKKITLLLSVLFLFSISISCWDFLIGDMAWSFLELFFAVMFALAVKGSRRLKDESALIS